MTPTEYYNQAVVAGHIQEDPRQRVVLIKLDEIYKALTKRQQKKTWLARFQKKIPPVTGLYLWGSVGIGKTFLMDCFYHTLEAPKLRLHFHQFMSRTHDELKKIQGKKNPLQLIAKNLSEEVMVICFDEFFVSDIADAMILGELFTHLFENGVTLVTSSNIPPDLLYKEGLQRERFLPTISLIKHYTDVVHLHSKMDYRQQHIRESGVFYTPENAAAKKSMGDAFTHFSNAGAITHDPIMICDRPIKIIQQAGSVIWFDFETICGRPRSQLDYLAITQRFHTILVSNLRAIQPNEKDLALSFIYFVDILYDSHCRLIISSDVPINKIINPEKSELPFERTVSRLIEMQSEKYIYPDEIDKELTNI